MISYLFIDYIWPEFAEVLATRPITIHEFHSTGKESLNKNVLWVHFKFIMLIHESTLYSYFPAG